MKSHVIRAIGYNYGVLLVVFTSGKAYRYKCAKKLYKGLKRAKSKGKYFNAHIRNEYKGELA